MLKGWLLFVLGGGLYMALEYFWRGRSHVSMFIAGGCALVLIGGIVRRFPGWSMWLICAAGAIVITAIEFIVGAVVNVRMGLNVWDYSDAPLNVYGQICLPYTLLWYGLCAPAVVVVNVVNAL